ncbi:hypothetical protein FACS189426_20670 [Bacteroidia bacterium]|nr:hypothetical protein FACS189426_20670 [Bacteroidia bacterium]
MKTFILIIPVLLVVSCTHTVSTKNEKAGKLKATYQLVISGEKKILLDDNTAPKPPYIQMVEDSSGLQILTFLNPYMNAIYFYDYINGSYIGNTRFEKEGQDAILHFTGYHIKNSDSIYVYNIPMTQVALTDNAGHVKQRISLREDVEWARNSNWTLYYPQYNFNTVTPFIETQEKLLLTGFMPIAVPDSLIDKFRFTSSIDIKANQVEFYHTYPKELFGQETNWDDLELMVYPELSPTGELIYSFPMSHDLYISKSGAETFQKVYAGSNVAKTIHSINRKQIETPKEVMLIHCLQQDIYTAVRYDSWRNVYYRFMLQGITDATFSTPLGKKPIIVIMMDEKFNYLGETLIGTGEEWNWQNSFVTKEGLNIEYIGDIAKDLNEAYLDLRIFSIEKL